LDEGAAFAAGDDALRFCTHQAANTAPAKASTATVV
jgi:hypothetical protein